MCRRMAFSSWALTLTLKRASVECKVKRSMAMEWGASGAAIVDPQSHTPTCPPLHSAVSLLRCYLPYAVNPAGTQLGLTKSNHGYFFEMSSIVILTFPRCQLCLTWLLPDRDHLRRLIYEGDVI